MMEIKMTSKKDAPENVMPECDHGHDREYPPNKYVCDKCSPTLPEDVREAVEDINKAYQSGDAEETMNRMAHEFKWDKMRSYIRAASTTETGGWRDKAALMDKIIPVLNEARCLSVRTVGNHELAERIVVALLPPPPNE
ncbi:MAG: hypothetical protein KGJ90_06835 [Patescibacteria group bacterium]|nr:hypothetical protein [Patescibacteria group bacterium]